MANIFEFLSKDGNNTPEKARKSWQMQFRDKTAYVWGLRYRWDPSLSRNPVPWFPHIMPPWCNAVESNETHGCPARHYFAILSLSLSPGSYCNDSDAVAGVMRARLNAAISESPQADQAQVSQNWLEIVLIVQAATRWLIAPPPPPLAAILPWRNQWSRNGLLLLQNIVINVWGVLHTQLVTKLSSNGHHHVFRLETILHHQESTKSM